MIKNLDKINIRIMSEASSESIILFFEEQRSEQHFLETVDLKYFHPFKKGKKGGDENCKLSMEKY